VGIAPSIAGVDFLTVSADPGGISQNPLLGNILEFLAKICAAGNGVSAAENIASHMRNPL
jgi:hypothetical protein